MNHTPNRSFSPSSAIHIDVFDPGPDLHFQNDDHPTNFHAEGSRGATGSLEDAEEYEQDIDILLYSDEVLGNEQELLAQPADYPIETSFAMNDIVDSDISSLSFDPTFDSQMDPISFDDFMGDHQIDGIDFLNTDEMEILEFGDPLVCDDMSWMMEVSSSADLEDAALRTWLDMFEDDQESPTEISSPSSSSSYMTTTPRRREWVLENLEAIASQFFHDLSFGRAPRIRLSSRSCMQAIVYDEEKGVIRRRQSPDKQEGEKDEANSSNAYTKTSQYGSIQHKRGVHSIIRATELIHENICKGTIVSKRDLYYKDVLLFGSQPAVDNIAEDLACTLQVPRSCLNVVAGIRSMVYGSVRLVISARDQKIESAKGTEDNRLNGTSSQTTYNTLVVIPGLMDDVLKIEIHPSTRFILVVEKEAAMEYLISSGFCSTHGPCILLTSKGYPDKVVRQLLKYLSDMIDAGVHSFSPLSILSRDVDFGSWGDLSSLGRHAPLDIPLFAFVDCDPHGIEIYLTYKCGSILSAYDNANLAVPKLACLGQIPDDWNVYLTGEKSHLSDQFQRQMISLSPRDRSKLVNMLKQHPYVRRSRAWTRQISRMLMMNRKTELQSLSLSETFRETGLGRGRDADNSMEQISGNSLIQYLERKLQDPRLWI